MYALEQERSHPVPPPPPLSMDRIPAASAYPTPGSAGPLRSSDYLTPMSTIHEGRIWSLQVVQQPIRARMCGFGDKVSSVKNYAVGSWFSLLIMNSFLSTRIAGRSLHLLVFV